MPQILEQIVEVSLFVATHVVDHGSGMFSTGFTGGYAPRAVFPTSRRMEKCAHSMFRRAILPRNLDFVSMSPMDFAVFSAVGALRQVILWEPSTTKSSSLSRESDSR